MFYQKVQQTNGEKATNHVPNNSHLHRMTIGKPNVQSHIPKKQLFGQIPGNDADVAVASSVVSSFLQAINAKENGVGLQKAPPSPPKSNLYKTQHTVKLNSGQSEPAINHLGLRKVNGSESAVANRVRNFNTPDRDESDVVLRRKSAFENKKETVNGCKSALERTDTSNDMNWKMKFDEAERRRKELLTESQKCK